jgi:transcriptional regulator with XRE-family HTH domain
MNAKTSAAKIKAVRTALKLTQDEFSDGLDISQAALSYLEKGESLMSLPVLQNLISIYEVNPYYFLSEDKSEPMFMKSRKSNQEMRELRSKIAGVKKSLAIIEKEAAQVAKRL